MPLTDRVKQILSWYGSDSPGVRANLTRRFSHEPRITVSSPEELASKRAFYNFRYTDPGLADLSGDSVFFKDEKGTIFHTYSTFGRGGEEFLGAYRILDVMPKGRDENGPYHSLTDWVRPKNVYGQGGMVEGNGRYHVPSCACTAHR